LLKNGTEAAIPGVFAPRKLRKVKPRTGMEAGCMGFWVLPCKNPKLKNGTKAAIPGVFAERKLRKVKLRTGMEAGCIDFWVFALQKPKAKKWHGGHFLAAQGIGGARQPQRGCARSPLLACGQ
jgi:hypothetical protein